MKSEEEPAAEPATSSNAGQQKQLVAGGSAATSKCVIPIADDDAPDDLRLLRRHDILPHAPMRRRWKMKSWVNLGPPKSRTCEEPQLKSRAPG